MTSRSRKPRSGAAAPASAARRTAPPLTALAIAGVVFVVCAVWIMPFMPDDSFISFRYSEHLADGHGLVFNIGERVEAYSNFLWIVVCAALYKAGLSLPHVTPYFGILLGLVCLWVLWTLCRREAPLWTQQIVPLILLATCGPFVIYAVSGMETLFFALLLMLMVLSGDDFMAAPGVRRLVPLVAFGYLASLARPEGIVAFPVALLAMLWASRRDDRFRRILRLLAIGAACFGALVIAYHAWRVSYFGEWLPTSFMSKGAEGGTLVSGWQKNFYRYFLKRGYFSPPQGYLFLALFVLGVVGLRKGRSAGARVWADWMALAVGVALPLVYASFVDWMPGMRYHAAVAGVLLVPSRHLYRLLPENVWEAAAGPRVARFTAAIVTLVLAGAVNLSQLRHHTSKLTESAQLCLLPLAEWLRVTMPPGSLLAIGDVGMIPYYSGLRTLDINPESLTDEYIAKHAFSADYAMTRHPAVIVLSVRGVYSARMDPLHWTMYKSEGFRLEYAFLGTSRNYWHDDRAYWVFVRRDILSNMGRITMPPEGIGLQHKTASDP